MHLSVIYNYSFRFSDLFAIIGELPRPIDGCGHGMWLAVINNAIVLAHA